MSTTAPIIPAGFQPVSTAPATAIIAPTTTVSVPTKSNGFVSFFKKLGTLFVHGAEAAITIVKKDAPAIENVVSIVGTLTGNGAAVNAGIDTFNSIFNTVVGVEQVATAVGASSGTGVQKLTAALPGVEQAILANPIFAGLKIADLTKYNAAIVGIASSMVDLANSFETPSTVS